MDTLEKILLLLVAVLFVNNIGSNAREDVKVTIIVDPPYCYEGSDGVFRGFIPEMMSNIEEITGLSFHFEKIEDGKYGTVSDKGYWNGMIGKVYRQEATIGAGPITVTDERKSVVDFTTPFMKIDLSLLMPKEDAARKITKAEDLLDQNDLNYGVAKPSSTYEFFRSTKFLTYAKMFDAMLKHQSFVLSSEEGIKKVRASANTPQKYGLLMESAMANYHASKPPCDLTAVPIIKDHRNHSLAVSKSWPKKDQLNRAIEELKTSGKLAKLESKWWAPLCTGVSSNIAFGWMTIFMTLGAVLVVEKWMKDC